MEVLILDSLLRPIDVVDQFESMIWTERFSEQGDFELVTLSTSANQKRFVAETWITITQSKRIMEIETIEETVDAEERMILKIKGFEITKILERRAALKAITGGVAPVWFIESMTPGNVMRHIFDQICVLGTVSSADIIPFYDAGTLYPADTIVEPSDLIDWEQKPSSVYAALKELGDIYDLGHRLYRNPNLPKLYFDVYAGSDRTTAQTALPAVIFSPDMDNLQNTRELSDVSSSFNVVRVIYTFKNETTDLDEAITVEVQDDEITPPEGFDRRVKILLVTSIPDEVTDIPAFLTAAGLDELMKSRPVGAFDGEIIQNSQYVYEQHYYLGDLVEIRSRTGATAYMRVEEYIFVQDREGERSYPTFTTKEFISPGTWLSWKYDVEWSAMGSEEYWATQ